VGAVAAAVAYQLYPIVAMAQEVKAGRSPWWGMPFEVVFASCCLAAGWLGLAGGPRRGARVLLGVLVPLILVRAFVLTFGGGFAYVTIICGLVLSFRSAMFATCALSVLQAVAWYDEQYPWASIVVGCVQIVLVGLGVAGLRRMVDLTGELSLARDRLAQLAVAQERLRFARDLHDLLGHSLSLIVLKSELARRLLQEGGSPNAYESLAPPIRGIETTARNALAEIRSAVSSYRGEFASTQSDHGTGLVNLIAKSHVTASDLQICSRNWDSRLD
jgi:two-component system sensor histidine kinase DesK